MTSLRHDEYVPFAPDDKGQIKMAHLDCEHGEDHKERLYIRRMANGDIKAKCHNCGKSGVFSEPKHIRNLHSLLKKAKEDVTKTKTLKVPYDAISISAKHLWPDKALAFPYLADLTDKDIDDLNLLYSAQYNRVIIPLSYDGDVMLWQGRDLDGNDPKYITMTHPEVEVKPMGWVIPSELRGKTATTVYIVEDMLSAYRIGLCRCNAVALLGTNCSVDQATAIANRFDRAVIFLDDDNATVKKQARNLVSQLSMVMKEDAGLIMVGKDPKRHGRKELCTVLETASTVPLAETGSLLSMREATVEKEWKKVAERIAYS